MKRLEVLVLVLTLLLSATLLVTARTRMSQIGYNNADIHWDDPVISLGYATCDVLDIDDAKLIEEVRVELNGEVVWVTTRDTGWRGFEAIGSGLSITRPFSITVETDDFQPVAHELRNCPHWLVYGACDGTEPITQTICLKSIIGGQLVEVDADCCWTAEIFTGTAALRQYLPIILKGRR